MIARKLCRKICTRKVLSVIRCSYKVGNQHYIQECLVLYLGVDSLVAVEGAVRFKRLLAMLTSKRPLVTVHPHVFF
jgi:hypothetical protein